MGIPIHFLAGPVNFLVDFRHSQGGKLAGKSPLFEIDDFPLANQGKSSRKFTGPAKK